MLQKQKEKCIHQPVPEGKYILRHLIPGHICQIWLSMTWIVIIFSSGITVTIPEECLCLSGILCMYYPDLEVPEDSEVFVSVKRWHKPFRKHFCVVNWALGYVSSFIRLLGRQFKNNTRPQKWIVALYPTFLFSHLYCHIVRLTKISVFISEIVHFQ